MLDRILTRTAAPQALTRAWPVGQADVLGWETSWGHEDRRFSPDELQAERYATANDVYSIITSRSRLLSGLELKFYKGHDSKKKSIEDGRPVELYQYVNDFWTPNRLARMDEMAMCIWGQTFWALEPPSKDHPLGEIWWLKAANVTPAPHPEEYLSGYWYQSIRGERIFFKADEIVWFRYPNPLDEFAPLSPLVAAKLAADTGQAMMTANQQLFDQGMQIAGLVTPANPEITFTEDQADDLELHLKKRFTGPKNAHRWAVLRYEAQFKQMSMTPKDAEFVSGLNMTFRQVARAFGMQPTLHGDLEQASPGDTDALERIEWARTLRPDADLKAAEIREQYLPRFAADKRAPDYCEYDYESVPALQEAEGAVWEREAGWLDRGLLTINEWRDRRGMGAVKWGEAPWLPLNKAQYIDGKLVIPGQDMGGGGFGAGGGLPQDAMQGGPQPTDDQGVPLEQPPDDERNPSNQPERGYTHWQARDFLATFNRSNGHSAPTR